MMDTKELLLTDHVNNSSQIKVGALLATLAFFIGTTQNALIKSIAGHVSTVIVVYTQYLLCSIFFLPKILQSPTQALKTNHLVLLSIRALSGLGYFFCMFYALKFIPLVDVSLLTNSAPFWVPFVCLIWLHTPIQYRLYYNILIGFIGVALVLAPNSDVLSEGGIIALLGGISMAISIISVRQLSHVESAARIMIYYFFIATLVMTPLAIYYWQHLTLNDWMILIINAILMVFQQQLVIQGFKRGPTSKLSVTTYSSVIFAAIIDWLFWHEVPTITTWIGAILIIVGGYKTLTAK